METSLFVTFLNHINGWRSHRSSSEVREAVEKAQPQLELKARKTVPRKPAFSCYHLICTYTCSMRPYPPHDSASRIGPAARHRFRGVNLTSTTGVRLVASVASKSGLLGPHTSERGQLKSSCNKGRKKEEKAEWGERKVEERRSPRSISRLSARHESEPFIASRAVRVLAIFALEPRARSRQGGRDPA